MTDYIFQPTIDEFKRQFNVFSYTTDNEVYDASVVLESYVEELLQSKSVEVSNIIKANGYSIPTTKDSNIFSIKQYILFSVAEVITCGVVSNSDIINYIREKSKSFADMFYNNYGKMIDSVRSYDSIPLEGVNLRQ